MKMFYIHTNNKLYRVDFVTFICPANFHHFPACIFIASIEKKIIIN